MLRWHRIQRESFVSVKSTIVVVCITCVLVNEREKISGKNHIFLLCAPMVTTISEFYSQRLHLPFGSSWCYACTIVHPHIQVCDFSWNDIVYNYSYFMCRKSEAECMQYEANDRFSFAACVILVYGTSRRVFHSECIDAIASNINTHALTMQHFLILVRFSQSSLHWWWHALLCYKTHAVLSSLCCSFEPSMI